MGQVEKQKEVFLSVCGQHDYDLLTGKEAMTQTDFERITYITMVLGYTTYTQELISEHLDLACNEAERTDREIDILQDYPLFYVVLAPCHIYLLLHVKHLLIISLL